MPNGTKSVVMNASTDLMTGEPQDAQVQVTIAPDGTAFISVYNPITRKTTYLRISADEWTRMEALA